MPTSNKKGMRPQGFPKEQVVKLRYCETVSVNPGAGAIDSYQFVANGCHDPNLTGVGHQPYLWDEWKAFYNHYVVLGSKISVQMVADSESNQSSVICGVYLSDDSTISTNAVALCEKGLTHYKVVPQGRQVVSKLDYKFSAKEFFNVTDVKDNLDRLGAAITANPTETAIFSIFARSLDGASDPTAFDMLVTLDYIVAFSEPTEIGQS